MGKVYGRDSIDLVLVPAGLAIVFGYHIYLLYMVRRHPLRTVIGFENYNKKAWVTRMLKGNADEAKVAVDVIASNITASNTLATISITLSSIIGTWISTSSKLITPAVIYGATGASALTVKYVSILSCFLIAFASFVQAARHYVHSSFLVTTINSNLPVDYVLHAVIRGGEFWSLGLRALYMAMIFLMWIFGPIPMFVASLLVVIVQAVLDANTTPPHPFNFDDEGDVKQSAGTKADTATSTGATTTAAAPAATAGGASLGRRTPELS